jgi:hypothetical protein
MGRYAGDGSACEDIKCDTADEGCPCDWNGDGRVDLRDIRAFMQSFEDGDADFDGDEDTDQDDVIGFLMCVRDGCN